MSQLTQLVQQTLLPNLQIHSQNPDNPVVPEHIPHPWQILGCGNYAAVLCHPDHPDRIVKVYAPGRPGIQEEAEVYQRLGSHPAYSECYHVGDNYLILRRLYGTTLYDSLHNGQRIPKTVIQEIDRALAYARLQGLRPHDVHGRNVMMAGQQGLVVDVSDFLKKEDCGAWRDLRRAYYWIYRPLISPLRLKVPYGVIDLIRITYRKTRRTLRWLRSQYRHRTHRRSRTTSP
jgi:serine/threonine protein kinase